MTAHITAEQTAAFYEARGYAAEQADSTTLCTECRWPADPSDLTRVADQDVCLPCARLLLDHDLDHDGSWRDPAAVRAPGCGCLSWLDRVDGLRCPHDLAGRR